MKLSRRIGITMGLCFMLGSTAPTVSAAVSGKIFGQVINSKTNEPVVGATVRITGTNLAGETDEDGEFLFLSIPVGKYDISVSHIGFETMTKKDVRVLVDLTTPVDFDLTELTVNIGREMIVYAAEPIIQRDLTSSRVIFTADRLKHLPNIITVQSVLSNYPGVVVDRDSELHVRGGRSGELAFLYDGFSVQDPFVSDVGIRIIPAALEELSLVSGGYGAEYGDAQSGIVSAVTREGSSLYRGSIRTWQGFTSPYSVTSGTWGDLKHVDNRAFGFDISGPLPGGRNGSSFFAAGEFLRDQSSLPHDRSVGFTGTMKVSIHPMNGLKLIGHATYAQSHGELYEHRDVNGASFDFNLNGLPSFEKRAYLGGITGNYAASERTIWSLSLSRFSTRTLTSPKHLMGKHWSEWPGYSQDSTGAYNGTVHENNYLNNLDYSDAYEAHGFATGDRFDPTYKFRQADYNSVSVGFVRQWTRRDQIKAGLEFRKYDVTRDSRQFFNDNPYAETYITKPTYVSGFVQNKMEYADFVINLGLRYDYRNTDIAYNTTPELPVATYKKADPKVNWSPRIGISFPVSLNSVMHFNYGLYTQMPQYYYLYINLEGDNTSGVPLFGNPDLKPELTTSYELGLDHLLTEGLRLDLTAFYKDVKDLITTRIIGQAGTTELTGFVNADYGSVSGIDVSLEKLPGNGLLSGSISYGFMNAKGTGSDALVPYYTFLHSPDDSLAPVTEYSLDFDQRHTVTAVVDFRTPADWGAKLFGLRMPTTWGLNVVGYYGSGLPYTKTNNQGKRVGERNAYRMPAVLNFDMRFNKDWTLGRKDRVLSFFVEVDNLFNRKNVVNVYTATGLANDDYARPGGNFSLSQEEVDQINRLYDHDPQHYAPPRTIRTGFQLSF